MKKTLVVLAFCIAVVGGFAATIGVHHIAYAEGQAQVDAGVAAAPATPPSATVTAPDPVEHPKEAYDSITTAFKKGWPIGLVFALYLIVGAASSRAKKGSFLDRGRLPTVLAGATSGLLAVLLALTHETSWAVAFGAIAAAVGTALHADPPKKAAAMPLKAL